jgi:murein DD-endopeptidase MepM/ murein hydrolase activator NlpD
MFEFSKFSYHPVIKLPAQYEVYDFTQGYDPGRKLQHEYGIGKYNERRAGMYTTELFTSSPEVIRNIHIGIDIAAPVETPVHAFYDGEIFMTGVNPAAGDYGGTVITQHRLGDRLLWALHGHLSHASTRTHAKGTKVSAGQVIAWVGDKNENGGWNPHLHFQLSWEEPRVCDMPGAVNERDLAQALKTYPDPCQVLGKLY